MRKLLGRAFFLHGAFFLIVAFFLMAAFPATAGKNDDVTTCVLPVRANWSNMGGHFQLGKPPQPGDFFVDISMDFPQADARSSGSFRGYVGVACGTPDSVKMTFHHNLVLGWEAKPAN